MKSAEAKHRKTGTRLGTTTDDTRGTFPEEEETSLRHRGTTASPKPPYTNSEGDEGNFNTWARWKVCERRGSGYGTKFVVRTR